MNKTVCLLSPPSRSINHYRPPLALLYLAGYLEKNEIKTEIIDITLNRQIRDTNFLKNLKKSLKKIEQKIVDEVKKINPDIVGITCYTPEYFETSSLAEQIKRIDKNIKVIVGGIHPTFYPQDFIYKESPVDFAVLGEGEVSLLKLVKGIRGGKELNKIESIAFFDNKEQKAIITPKRCLWKNLDEISWPAYHKINMDYYTTANPYAIRGVFTRSAYVISSRGCPSQCTFCVSKKIREFAGSIIFTRLRSPEHLFNEVKHLRKKYKIDSFYFIDDLFTLNKDHVKKFCQLLSKSGLGLIWGCSSKVTTVNYETLKLMRDAGCVQIDFGVERGSNEALRKIKKGITVEIIKKVFFNCRKLGIRTFANMLVNLPGETEKDLEDILKLLDEIKPTIVSLNIFTPYPGTEIFETYNVKIPKNEYSKLMKDAPVLIKEDPENFKFYKHNVDLGEWTDKYNKKYNKILPTLFFYFSPRYLKNLAMSKMKINYLEKMGELLKEFINQKFK